MPPWRSPARPRQARASARRGIRAWLLALFAMVVVMIVVGGLTRLTDSGLSITEWNLVTGAIPPLTAVDWIAEFDKYRATSEFQLQNSEMSLEQFKVIYWWEWGHRQWGRLIGLVWAAGLGWFALRGRVPSGWMPRLLLLGALGGLQGAAGWWMVSSGLEGQRVDVASYRLAVHLGLAFAILGLIGWYVMRLGLSETALMAARRRREAGRGQLAGVLVGLAFLQILLGALVAGIDAGRYFPEWPTMAGQFFPPDALLRDPVWRNVFEESGAGTVQSPDAGICAGTGRAGRVVDRAAKRGAGRGPRV